MSPTLPNDDPLPLVRHALLELSRSQRKYDYSLPVGVAALAELLPEDKPGPEYLAKIAESNAHVSAHHVEYSVSSYEAKKPRGILAVEAYALKTLVESVKDFWDATDAAAAESPKSPLASLSQYGDITEKLEAIPVVDKLRADPKRADELYGWQRIGGINPMQIQRIEALPDHFPVTEGAFARALGTLRPALVDDSLARALAEGRAFLSDCSALDGVPTTSNAGRRKYTAAPLGLFVHPRDHSADLLPIAIQCGQKPSEQTPIFTPADGYRWRIAQAFLQSAESTIHEGGEHLGLTHMVMEAFAMAASRQLANAHPLWALLKPHFQGTHFINYTARHSLIADGGTLDQLMAQPIDVTRTLVKASMDGFRIDEADPETRLRKRGLLDTAGLPNHPYREDALPLYRAISTWVSDYVRIYYVDDAAVASDVELQAFVGELGAKEGGRLAGVPVVKTIDGLVSLVSLAIFTGSVQHAAVNFPQYPFMGWVANMPASLYAPPPTMNTPDVEASLRDALPQADVTFLQMYTVYQLSAIRNNKLGDYPAFDDVRVAGPLGAFRQRLADLEPGMRARDATRPLPYPYLLPSLLPSSIII